MVTLLSKLVMLTMMKSFDTVTIFCFSDRVGLPTAEPEQGNHITLNGTHILPHHCSFQVNDGTTTLLPCEGGLCYVNGKVVTEPISLKTGSRVILGKSHVYRFTDPDQGIMFFTTSAGTWVCQVSLKVFHFRITCLAIKV